MRAWSWVASVVLLLVSVAVLALGIRQTTLTAAAPEPSAPQPAATAPPPADSAQQRDEVTDFGRDSAVRLLGYTPQTAARDLPAAARELTTGPFREKFTSLINDVVIPGSTSKQITAVAEVPAIAVESLDRDTATLIAFIDQTVTMGANEPTDTTSSVRMKLQKKGDRWLVAAFDPL